MEAPPSAAVRGSGLPRIPPGASMTAPLVARALLSTRSVHFRPEDPFTLSSGLRAPTYVDCRRLIGFPEERGAIMDAMAERVRPLGVEIVAGGETAGIPFAAWLAERLGLPMAYVRKKAKGHGRGARIEGPMEEGRRVLLVEDLTTDGGSKISFVDAIRDAGAECAHTAVVFAYGLATAEERLAAHGVALHALCGWAEVIAEARRSGAFDEATLGEVEAFLAEPDGWRARRGFAIS